ncbi:helix-turn-helix transcriptional regulator [Alteribacter natronophilus]|uniref:helix-turn-helix transcriptional regulator n=1 Tax=Alteribacter natronophilus TaxID=2583810 RepID=UPI00110EC416|nr:helix-turn-helix transcriptional regulator [Alteribacter natronophilus]TMW70651.1 hypothetical protein FGB90_15835 [Alteribacter natronophilus]
MNGKILKYHRLKQRKKQGEVAKGICSVSYYSKIENDQIDVGRELMEQLLNRLEIHDTVKSVHDEKQLKEKIHQFNELIIDRELEEAGQLSDTLHDHLQYVQNPQLIVFYETVQARYKFLRGEHASGQALLEKNESFVKEIEDAELKFHYLKMKSVFYFLNQKAEQALLLLKEADGLRASLHLPHKDVVDLYYMLGVSSYRVKDINASMYYMKEAVRVYDSNYDYQRSGDCRLMLGLCYKGIRQYENAEKQYELAMKLAKNIQHKQLEAKVLQARGELLSAKGQSFDAITAFQMSYRLREGTNRLICIHAILKEFYKIGQYSELLSWIDHGFEILKEAGTRANSFLVEQYRYHFNYYNHIATPGTDGEFEEYLSDEVVPFFEKHERFEEVHVYAKDLALRYERKQHHRKAAIYYKKAMKALEIMNYEI